jgi:hypothetical protein
MGNRLIRRDRKTVAEERVRAMVARRKVLWDLGREGRLRVPLDEPLFWGYRRSLVLRADVMRRKDAARLLALLPMVQKEEDCRRKDFKRWDKQTRRWMVWNHTPRKLSPWEYAKLPEDQKCYFERIWSYWKGTRYMISEPWMFVSKRSKLYITHRFVPNTEVEQELKYLNDRFEQSEWDGIATKVKTRRNRWKKRQQTPRKRRILDSIHRKEIGEAGEWLAQGKLAWARGKEVNEDAKA